MIIQFNITFFHVQALGTFIYVIDYVFKLNNVSIIDYFLIDDVTLNLKSLECLKSSSVSENQEVYSIFFDNNHNQILIFISRTVLADG